MVAIFKREVRSFFTSPLGYIFCGSFVLFINVIFTVGNIMSGSSDLALVFSWMILLLGFLTPILTMRLLSEEKKLKTDQALLTAPVSLYGIVLGKFFAALCTFVVTLIITLVFPLIVTLYGNPQPATIIGNYIAVTFFAMAFIAIGLFISSVTENQLISAVISLIIFIFINFVLDAIPSMTPEPISTIAGAISFNQRYLSSFGMGIFNFADALFYLSIAAIFLFLTVRVLEKKRYS